MTSVLARLAVATALCLAGFQAAGEWTYASSEHFEVYTTGGDRRAREALAHYERVHAFFTAYLKLSPHQRQTRLIVFSGDREFAPYRPNEFATAFYQSGPSRDVIVMRSLDADSAPIVVHEYAHLVIRRSGAVYPLWLNEGIAEFFSTLAIENDRATVGLVPLGRLRPLASGTTLLNLAQLFAVDRRSPEYTTKAHAGLFYSESWALTHMLLTDDRYRKQSGRFLEMMASGTPEAVAVEAAFGRTLPSVFRDLEGYVRRDRYQVFRMDYAPPKQDTSWPSRPASAFEGSLVAANLLADRADREDDARAAFEALTRQNPNDLTLVESRASFELGRGNLSEATPLLARAVELGTRSATLHRQYAASIGRSDVAKAEALYVAAIALDPGDIELRLDLATLLAREQRAAEALAALSHIKRVPEELAFVFFQVSANANALLGRLDEAIAAAARVEQHARGEDELRHAAQLRKSIEDFAAARAAVEQALRERGAAAGATPSVVGNAAPSAGAPTDARRSGAPGFQLVAQGRISNLTCGNPPILELLTDSGTLRLVIDDPLLIRVEGAGTITTDLSCGKQDTRVRLGYEAAVDPVRKTVGKVRLLDFRQ